MARNQTKPALYLIQPESVLESENEPDAMRWVGQKIHSGLHGVQDAGFSLYTQISRYFTVLGNITNQAFRFVGIEQQRAKILALAQDFPRLWNDPHTPDRERKRMVRLLIADVTN